VIENSVLEPFLMKSGEVWEIEIDGEKEEIVIFPKEVAKELHSKKEITERGVSVYPDDSPVGKKLLLTTEKVFKVDVGEGQLTVELGKKLGFVDRGGSFHQVEEQNGQGEQAEIKGQRADGDGLE